jgi:hypothetical protein
METLRPPGWRGVATPRPPAGSAAGSGTRIGRIVWPGVPSIPGMQPSPAVSGPRHPAAPSRIPRPDWPRLRSSPARISEQLAIIISSICPSGLGRTCAGRHCAAAPAAPSALQSRLGSHTASTSSSEDRDRGQRTQNRGQRTEDSGQRTQDRGQSAMFSPQQMAGIAGLGLPRLPGPGLDLHQLQALHAQHRGLTGTGGLDGDIGLLVSLYCGIHLGTNIEATK